MNYYKLKISYAGQNYFGWQIQKETELTIQGLLEKALRAATGIKKTTLWRFLRRRWIVRRSNSLKPLLNEFKKRERLEFII